MNKIKTCITAYCVPFVLFFLILGTFHACKDSVNADEGTNEGEDEPAIEIIEVDEDFRHYLILVMDGLRPDYITPALMPNLYNLGQHGIIAENHHVVYPAVTRVNSASLATGAYPGTHGLVHNHIYLPKISHEFLSTGNMNNVRSIDPLLTATSLGETLEQNDYVFFVSTSASRGTSYLLNHTVVGAGIWNSRGMILPEEKENEALEILGEYPSRTIPNIGQNRWAIDAYLTYGIDSYLADVAIVWLNDPDGTAHAYGVGTSRTTSAIRHVDAQLGRILDGLESRGLLEHANIFVTSDHGFSTREGGFNVNRLFGDGQGMPHGVTTRSGNRAKQLYFARESDIETYVRILQDDASVGHIFTHPKNKGDIEGRIEGTFSIDLINNNHERTADVLIGATWSDKINDAGYPGFNTAHISTSSIAGHDTASPYEMMITLTASGPDIKTNTLSFVPSGNVDIAPTILHLLGLPIPDSMDGRVLKEFFKDGPDPESVEFQIDRYETSSVDWNENYKMVLYKARVGDFSYFQQAHIDR